MRIGKFEMYYNLLERWLTVHEEGRTLSDILAQREIFTIALYGMGKIGKHVINELKGSSITVVYAIDRAQSGLYDSIVVKRIDDTLPKVDAVLVAAVYDFDEIEETLRKYVTYPIISLEEILYEG